jgi:hypothetical protein
MTPDNFSDSFYYRAIRTKIGEVLRGRFEPTERPPKQLMDLLHALDVPQVDAREPAEELQDAKQKRDNHG